MDHHADTGTFGNDQAAAFVQRLIDIGRGRAGERLVQAMRTVEEAGDSLDPLEANEGRVAVTLLLAEEEPSLLDGAAQEDRLRIYLRELDTELTPARRTLAKAVVERILLPVSNAWYDAWQTDEARQAALASVQRLADLLADA